MRTPNTPSVDLLVLPFSLAPAILFLAGDSRKRERIHGQFTASQFSDPHPPWLDIFVSFRSSVAGRVSYR